MMHDGQADSIHPRGTFSIYNNEISQNCFLALLFEKIVRFFTALPNCIFFPQLFVTESFGLFFLKNMLILLMSNAKLLYFVPYLMKYKRKRTSIGSNPGNSYFADQRPLMPLSYFWAHFLSSIQHNQSGTSCCYRTKNNNIGYL